MSNPTKRTYVVRRSDSGNYHTGIDFGSTSVLTAYKIESDEPPESLKAKVRTFFGPHALLVDVTPSAPHALIVAADALVSHYGPNHPLKQWREFRAALAEFKKSL